MYRFEEIKNDEQLRGRLWAAMEIRRLIREWFGREGFIEVETPTVVRAPGEEPHLNPFELTVRDERGNETSAYLITSPEYALKKLLAAGFPKIFELARCFRNNEPTGGLHNPEFTMLEWYRAGTDYHGIMEDVEQLVHFIAEQLVNITTTPTLPPRGRGVGRGGIDFTPPWERLSVREAFKKYAATDLLTVGADDEFFKIFLSKIEKNLGNSKPTILYDYPASMAALARLAPQDVRYAERFEVYIQGIEIANAFSELIDAKEQRKRFLEEKEIRRRAGRPVHPIDEELLAALNACPDSAGIALGVDRLAMVLLDVPSIRDVMFFSWRDGVDN